MDNEFINLYIEKLTTNINDLAKRCIFLETQFDHQKMLSEKEIEGYSKLLNDGNDKHKAEISNLEQQIKNITADKDGLTQLRDQYKQELDNANIEKKHLIDKLNKVELERDQLANEVSTLHANGKGKRVK